MIHIYTDGNPVSWSFVVTDERGGSDRFEVTRASGENHKTTNNNEVLAIYSALEWIDENDVGIATIYSDSKYAIRAITVYGDAHKARGWGGVKNTDVIIPAYELYESLSVAIKWVRGHNGNKWNELADSICSEYKRPGEWPIWGKKKTRFEITGQIARLDSPYFDEESGYHIRAKMWVLCGELVVKATVPKSVVGVSIGDTVYLTAELPRNAMDLSSCIGKYPRDAKIIHQNN